MVYVTYTILFFNETFHASFLYFNSGVLKSINGILYILRSVQNWEVGIEYATSQGPLSAYRASMPDQK